MTDPSQAPAPAPAPTPAPGAAPKPKTKGLVRWGVVIFLLVAFAAFAFVGAAPVTKWAVEKYGSQGLGSEVKVEAAAVDVLKMAVTLKGVRQLDAVDPSKNAFQAEEVRAKLDPLAMLRGQLVIDELALVKPKGRLVRNTDGSINGKQTEEKPAGTSESEWKKKLEEMARKRDLVEDVKSLLKKVKEKRDAQVAQKKEEAERKKTEGMPADKDGRHAGRADWVKEARPLVVIHRIIAEGVELELEDQAAGAPPQKLENATVEIRELSTSPSVHDQPIELKLNGAMAGAPGSQIKIDGKLDLTAANNGSAIDAHLANLPLAALDAFYKDAIPVAFQGKTLGTLDLPLNFRNWEIDWKPTILLDQIDAKARDPSYRIAGQFQASQVAQELTNAGKFALEGTRIYGPIWAPKVEINAETFKALILEGGKNYALKKGNELFDKEKQKLLERNPELQKKLDETGAGKILEGAGDKLGVGGLFGGGDKNKPADKPADKDKQTDKPQPPKPNQPPPQGDKSAADKAGDAAKGAADAIGDIFGGKKK